MVNRPLTPRDLELLSAYIDHQLSPREQQWIEERLRSNPGLQDAFNELRRTHAMLRSLPKVRAPRNFTISPAMVPVRRQQPLFGLPLNWTAASVLSTLMLVVFFFGDLLGFFSPRLIMQTAQRPAEAQALETAMNQIDIQSKASAQDTQDPGFAMALPPENERGMGGGGGGDGTGVAAQANPVVPGTPSASADQMLVFSTPTPSAIAIQPMLEMSVPSTLTTTLTTENAQGTEMAFVPPSEQPAAPAASRPETTTPQQVLFTPWWIRIIETALLLIALGAGLLAFTRRAR